MWCGPVRGPSAACPASGSHMRDPDHGAKDFGLSCCSRFLLTRGRRLDDPLPYPPRHRRTKVAGDNLSL